MNLNKKVKRLGLLPLDSKEVTRHYKFPDKVKNKYQYIKMDEPLLLYSTDYLMNHKLKVIKQGQRKITGEVKLSLKDRIAFKVYLIMK